MKIVFLTNYYNHHQKPLCESLYFELSDNFRFISTDVMSEERIQLGYQPMTNTSFVEYTYLDEIQKKRCQQIIDDADVVMVGSADEKYLYNRNKYKKTIFRYSERLYKEKIKWIRLPIRFFRFLKKYSLNKNQYLLCASAYASRDFALTGNFINKSYKWGYFPKTVTTNINSLLSQKSRKKILWCGRLIDWKHPDDVIYVAERLKKDGYDFEINFIGTGPMEIELRKMISFFSLEKYVHVLGSMNPEQVRTHMNLTGIYMLTSDFQEGWGAVLNEAMNSGCAVVASHAIGSVPFMLNNNKNGLIYRYGDNEDMYKKVKYFLDNPDEQVRMGKSAYYTILREWNAEVAAERFLRLVEEIKDHGYCDLFATGPCSKAEIIYNNWFRG